MIVLKQITWETDIKILVRKGVLELLIKTHINQEPFGLLKF